jgi:hypothetical protein
MSGHELDPATERSLPTGVEQHATTAPAGLRGLAGAVGNRAFAAAAIARRPAVAAVVARDPDDEAPPPVSPAVRALADPQIAPELREVVEALRADPPPTLEHLRQLRVRVATVRALFDQDAPAGGDAAANWGSAMVNTVLARTLLDGLLFPGSDAGLRLAWGKTLGTCRQLVGLLRAAEAATPAAGPAPAFEPAPSPNALPPPPPPPIGSDPPAPEPAAAKPADTMEAEICPRVEEAIGEIPRLVASATVDEIEAVRDRFEDIPEKIFSTAEGQEFGPVAALEFQKGLELINQATLAPPEQLADIAAKLEAAANRVTNLEVSPGSAGDEPARAPAFAPAPSPNPLPQPPPPPIEPR